MRRIMIRFFFTPHLLENVVAVFLTLIFASVGLLFLGISPVSVFISIIEGSILDLDSLSRVLLIGSIMSLSAFALIVTFSCNIWNIGIEGQMMMGAVGTVFIARTFLGDSVLAIPMEILTAMVFGSLFGLICGLLKTKSGVHEIFGGLGLDFIAAGLIVYLVVGPWKRDGIASTSGTDLIPELSWFPTLLEMKFPILPVVIFLFAYLFLKFIYSRTSLGLKLKSVGSNKQAFSRLGLSSDNYILLGFVIAGAVVGLAGSIQAAGIYHKLVPNISGGYGFLGILIALVSNRKLGVAIAISFIFSCLMVGGSTLQIKLGLHASLPGIVQPGLVLIWLLIKASSLDLKAINFVSSKLIHD